MTNLTAIEPDNFNASTSIIRDRLDNDGFYTAVSKINPEVPYNSVHESATIEAVVNGMGAHLAVNEKIAEQLLIGYEQKNKFGHKQEASVEQEFANMYSLYAGCTHLLETITRFAGEPQAGAIVPSMNIDFTQSGAQVCDAVLGMYITGVKGCVSRKMYRDGADLADMTRQFFSAIQSAAEKEIKDPRFAAYLEQMSNNPIEVNGMQVSGLRRRIGGGESVGEGIQFDEVIANDEAIHLVRGALDNIALYNPEKKSNILTKVVNIPRTFLMYAEPGTGKTTLLLAAMNYGQQLGEENSMPFTVRTISGSTQDKFVGETQKNLDADFDAVADEAGFGMIIIEDIDTILTNRAEGGSQEHKKDMLQHLMNKLQGVDTVYNGNYIVICTTNRPTDLDKALKDRISQIQVEVPGPQKADEYVALAQLKGRRGIKNGYLTISAEEKRALGAKCEEMGISGRELTNVVESILAKSARDITVDDTLAALSRTDEKAFLQGIIAQCVPHTGTDIVEGLDRYRIQTIEQERLARQEEITFGAKARRDEVLKSRRAEELLREHDARNGELYGDLRHSKDALENMVAELTRDKINEIALKVLKIDAESRLPKPEALFEQAIEALHNVGYTLSPDVVDKAKEKLLGQKSAEAYTRSVDDDDDPLAKDTSPNKKPKLNAIMAKSDD